MRLQFEVQLDQRTFANTGEERIIRAGLPRLDGDPMDIDLTTQPSGRLLSEDEERVGIGITHDEDIHIGGRRPQLTVVPSGP
ncbi:hypothetical protein RB628_35720 [Streptomyces sp. ADMS]|uniref:hypothetical protein n=1 Tax=Streptomyces sp. ADMS TaxID=3071415 RepID=UPI00296F1E49|nr:hypothetical protein [Streptomyces sp. ADMS]MDW4910536.1 hypothetical protein [Streptomyces sp. ADMS]